MKEQLQKRLQMLEAQIQQTLANYNALIGAKNELVNTIAMLDAQAVENAEKVTVDDTAEINQGCVDTQKCETEAA